MNDGTKFKLVRVDYANPDFAFDNKPTIAIYDYDKNGKYSLCGNEIYHCDWQDKINEQKAQEKRQQDQERAEKVKHQREEQLEEQKEKEEQKKENYNPENIKAQAQGFGQSTDSRLSTFNIKGYEGANNTIVYERHMYNAPVLFRVDYPNGITKVFRDHINGKLEYVGHTPIEVKKHGYL